MYMFWNFHATTRSLDGPVPSLLPQFLHVNPSSEEEDISGVDTGETETQDIW